jgi:hypothetical protein
MFGAWVKLGVSGATPDLRASPRGAHLATATPAATGLAAVHALDSRRRLTRPKRKPTAERPGGGRRVGRLMAPSIAIDIHPEGTAARVDVVNTFRCIRRSFHVVSRRFALSKSVFPQVTGPFAPSSIPGSSTKKVLVRTTGSGQFSFSSTFVVEIHSMTSLRLRPTGLRTPGALCVHQTVDCWSPAGDATSVCSCQWRGVTGECGWCRF